MKRLLLALVITATWIAVPPAGAKPKPPAVADVYAVNGCVSIHLQVEGIELGRSPTVSAVASIIDNLEGSAVRGAQKRGRKLEKAANAAAELKALRDAASWCTAIGQPPF